MTPDSELLAAFARKNSEDAFAELVKRHVNLVYSAALRQVNGDAHLAQDVAQAVFTDLARKAGSLARRETLTGWLYTSAHYAAAKMVRGETRRRDREEKFMREPTNEPAAAERVTPCAPEAEWETLRPALDDAMHELKEADREAILLRYFENRPFAEVGAKLGLNENAARMRVDRALEKLRAILSGRGITTATALASVISANAVQLAPAGLAATLTTSSIVSAGAGTFTIWKIMTMTKLNFGISALVVAGAATALVVQHQDQQHMRAENGLLRQQMAQLETDSEAFSNKLAGASNAKKLTDDQLNELLKLRGEVGMLRKRVSDLNKTQQAAGQMLASTQSNMAQARAKAEFKANEIHGVNNVKQICLAFRIVASDNNGQYPTNMSEEVLNAMGSTNLTDYAQTEVELVNQSVSNLINHPQMIQLRERTARQAPDGRWRRIYGLSDGSVQVAESLDGNFDAWEKQNTEIPPPNQ